VNEVIRDFLRPIGWAVFGYENYVKGHFKRRHGYEPDLKNPRTFSEKIQYLKVYGHLERFSKYADKYAVREFIKEKVGEELLIPLLGIYERTDTIDFKSLPDSFVMKATHGSGWNIIVQDKTRLDWNSTIKKMNEWLRKSYFNKKGEAQYKSLKRRILIEKHISDPTGDLKDYKFFCFHGEPKFIQVDGDRYTNHKRDIYDMNWNKLPVKFFYENLPKPVVKPEKLDNMLQICRQLSREFGFVRVDLYYADGRIYFGELTFSPENGLKPFDPVQYDNIFGEYLDLNNYYKS
jgi:hypothetical protein